MVDAKLVMKLRGETGAGVLECRKALEEVGGDFSRATALLKEKGIAQAVKKMDRHAGVGRVGSYIHGQGTVGRVGAMVELCCETDFVANTPEFADLLRDLCLQVAGAGPSVVSRDQLPADEIEGEKKKHEAEAAGKPPEVAAKIIEGKLLKGVYSQRCLLDQPFINPAKFDGAVADLIKSKISKFGENLTVRRFVRFEA